MAKMDMRAFDRLVEKRVRKVMGTITTHRVRMLSKTINTTTPFRTYVDLLTADDDPDYDIVSNGTTIAECHANSKIVKVQLKINLFNSSTDKFVEWALYRDPDQVLGTNATIDAMFTSDVSTNDQLMKKNAVAYGNKRFTSQADGGIAKIFIKRKALARIRTMHDNDKLRLLFQEESQSTLTCDIVGRIWTVHA